MALSRRDLLTECFAAGVLLAAPGIAAAEALERLLEAERLPATPRVEVGPFFKKGAPETGSLAPAGAAGLALKVAGRVVDRNGQPIPDARVEVWHADHAGEYDLEGFHYRGRLRPDAAGSYGFTSVIPGHYPARVAEHVHYLVTAPGRRAFSTQLYFATDPVFKGDPAKNFSVDPLVSSASLVRPVLLAESSDKRILAEVTFDLVLPL